MSPNPQLVKDMMKVSDAMKGRLSDGSNSTTKNLRATVFSLQKRLNNIEERLAKIADAADQMSDRT